MPVRVLAHVRRGRVSKRRRVRLRVELGGLLETRGKGRTDTRRARTRGGHELELVSAKPSRLTAIGSWHPVREG